MGTRVERTSVAVAGTKTSRVWDKQGRQSNH